MLYCRVRGVRWMAYVRRWEALLSPNTQRRVVYLYVCSTNGDASGTPLEVCPVKPSHHHIYMLITQWNLSSPERNDHNTA